MTPFVDETPSLKACSLLESELQACFADQPALPENPNQTMLFFFGREMTHWLADFDHANAASRCSAWGSHLPGWKAYLNKWKPIQNGVGLIRKFAVNTAIPFVFAAGSNRITV